MNHRPLGLQKEGLIMDEGHYEEAALQTLRLPNQFCPGDIRRYVVFADRARYYLFGKKTYGEFLESDEGIATNILASRLAQLVQTGILEKKPHATDKRKEVYALTEKGLDLIPILLELANWSAQHDP
jgi:hypothetical protein